MTTIVAACFIALVGFIGAAALVVLLDAYADRPEKWKVTCEVNVASVDGYGWWWEVWYEHPIGIEGVYGVGRAGLSRWKLTAWLHAWAVRLSGRARPRMNDVGDQS